RKRATSADAPRPNECSLSTSPLGGSACDAVRPVSDKRARVNLGRGEREQANPTNRHEPDSHEQRRRQPRFKPEIGVLTPFTGLLRRDEHAASFGAKRYSFRKQRLHSMAST